MSTDLLRYDLLVQDALKGVVRRVLNNAIRDGLPGDHHFYISFRTVHPGVRLSQRLRDRYPDDMTVVLQHQYENLQVNDAAFEVGLSFSGIAERLRIPFDALTGFFDPSVQFGLKFEATEDEEVAEPEGAGATVVPAIRGAVPKLGPRRLSDGDVPAERANGPDAKPGTPAKPDKVTSGKKASPRPAAKADSEDATAEPSGGEIVSLDSFRKKS